MCCVLHVQKGVRHDITAYSGKHLRSDMTSKTMLAFGVVMNGMASQVATEIFLGVMIANVKSNCVLNVKT